MDISKIKDYLTKLKQENVSFDKHFYKKAKNRPINEGMIRRFLSHVERLEKIEQGRKDRFKLWFKMSNKYSLILVVEVKDSKNLKIITAWNSNRKW